MVVQLKKPPDSQSSPEPENSNIPFQCNICLDTAKDAVVSQCGHLFCWPCLHRWLETRPDRQECPVCKGHINKEKCTPIYGHGSDTTKDPRSKVPPRPAGTHEPSQNTGGNSFFENPFSTFNGPNVQIGFGLFPFGLLGGFGNLGFNIGGNNNAPGNHGNGTGFHNARRNNAELDTDLNYIVQNFFLWVALLFFVWFVIAD